MRNYCILVTVLMLVGTGCKKSTSIETVTADLGRNSSANLLEYVSGIKLIPLETNDSLLIGSNNELAVSDGEYYVVNRGANDRVFRFDPQGKFLNTIGVKGRGPGEYPGLVNMQLLNDTVIIYASPGMSVNFYTKEGAYLGQKQYPEIGGAFFYKIGDEYLIYNGYGMQDPERVYLYSPVENSRRGFLQTDAKVINISDGLPAFDVLKDTVFIRETYNDTIFRYDPGRKELIPYLRFDFGKNAIDKKVFEFGDRMESAQYFMSLEYASVRRYTEDATMRLVEVIVNKKPLPEMIYGLNFKDKGEWVWFSGGKTDTGSLATSFRLLQDGKLYCLLEPYRLKNLTPQERAKITNPEMLDSLTESDNFVIGIIFF